MTDTMRENAKILYAEYSTVGDYCCMARGYCGSDKCPVYEHCCAESYKETYERLERIVKGENMDEFKYGDKVWVSDESIEDASIDPCEVSYFGFVGGKHWCISEIDGDAITIITWEYVIHAETLKEMTMADIEAMAGCKVKIIKE
jgi:hypothetical protein